MIPKKFFLNIKRNHITPPFFSGQRHLGLILSTMGWFIVAFITIFLRENITLYASPGMINLFFFHLGIVVIFFIFGIPYGLQFFKCNNPRLLLLRGVLAVCSFLGYTYAKNWSPHIDHSILFSIDPLWAVFLLLLANYKLNKLTWIGILVSLVGMVTIYLFNNPVSSDIHGFIFGLTSGAGVAAIILITYVLIKTDHPSRIGFYHGIIGSLICLAIVTYFALTGNFQLPAIREIIISLFLGIAFAYAIFCFLQSAYYADPYVIGVTGYSLIFFSEVLNWILTKEVISLASMVGTALIIFGGIKVVLGSYFDEEKKRQVSSPINSLPKTTRNLSRLG